MEDSEQVDEDVTRSNFALLENHNMDIKGSMGLFKERMPDLSAIEVHETMTQQFLISKSSSSSVFDRLASDTNRRANASMKVQDYRLMLELEYENSFLNPTRISLKRETSLISRLLLDSDRRKNNKEALENLKNSENSTRKFVKWPAEKTIEVVARLATDKRNQMEKREEVKNKMVEEEIRRLESIRNNRHPRRKIDKKVMERILGSISPRGMERKEEVRPKKSWNEVKKVVDRLHRTSPLKIVIKDFGGVRRRISPPKSARPVFSPSRKSNIETDDYLMTLKAKGKGTNYK